MFVKGGTVLEMCEKLIDIFVPYKETAPRWTTFEKSDLRKLSFCAGVALGIVKRKNGMVLLLCLFSAPRKCQCGDPLHPPGF